MKQMMTFTLCGFMGLNLMADDVKKPYLIQRENETLVVNDMPKFTVSEPITNSFIYFNGEYIPPPYIVSVSNLAVLINGVIVQDDEPRVHKREYYTGRVGATPETVGRLVDGSAESFVRGFKLGVVEHIASDGRLRGSMINDGDGGALALVKKARKAVQGDEQAKQELIDTMGLTSRQIKLRPDWIERLANNTNLETRATKILEAKREREKQEEKK